MLNLELARVSVQQGTGPSTKIVEEVTVVASGEPF